MVLKSSDQQRFAHKRLCALTTDLQEKFLLIEIENKVKLSIGTIRRVRTKELVFERIEYDLRLIEFTFFIYKKDAVVAQTYTPPIFTIY